MKKVAERIHELKTDPEPFDASLRGDKMYEIRFDDRDYRVGDMLVLRETSASAEEMKKGAELSYTGRALSRIVTNISHDYGVAEGWVFLGVRKV